LNVGSTSTLSLRIDSGSQLQFSAPDKVELQAGALYIDAGAHSSVPLTVQTVAGAVRHIGTQYQVRTLAGALRGIEVTVREGRVEIANQYGTNTGTPGERVAVSTKGSIARSAVAPYDASWEWAEHLAPPFEFEGNSLDAFLTWVARETGRELIYDSAAARGAALVVMRGSIARLNPDQALMAALSGSKLQQLPTDASKLHIALKAD
jgi:ferric-dicitrate binding protein FerR (iron transport regulator)